MADIKKTIPATVAHGLTVDNRNRMTVTGVSDVAGFSEEKDDIITTMGKLVVKWKKLNVNTLNTDTGELKLTGEINSLDYSNDRRGGGLFAGLFS